MQFKKCGKCKKEKPFSEFYRNVALKDKLNNWCKECLYRYTKKWRKENREKVVQQKRKWRKANIEKVREQARKQYKKPHTRKRANAYQRERLKTDPKFRLNRNVSWAVNAALKGGKAGRKWQRLVGYTTEELQEHLEAQFDDKMSWDNYGSYWQVDHKKPKAVFSYTSPKDPEFKECWALENLQPLEIKENRKKWFRY